jgi:hypothetical protein
MPVAEMILVGIVEDEWGSAQPEAAGQLSNLLPPSQTNELELSQRQDG